MPRLKRSVASQPFAEAAESDFLEALARGLRVIEVFDQDHKQLTLSDVAKAVGLPRASVRRTLHTLVRLGYAELNDRLFRLKPRVLALARAYLQSNAVTDILQPALEQLSEDVNESCSAAVLDGADIMMIAHASPQRIIPVSGQIGFRVPAVASALGRVLLAALSDDELDAFLARNHPRKLTPSTILDKTALRRAILKVRKEGYALVDQEVEPGFCSIAVPLKKSDGRIIASLNIGVHSARTPMKAMNGAYLAKLRVLAGRLQEQLI
jgi:IclR family pca regulon transcriptional regulator